MSGARVQWLKLSGGPFNFLNLNGIRASAGNHDLKQCHHDDGPGSRSNNRMFLGK
jgi:hypothetical protein